MPGYRPARTNQGWGIALLVCALAVVAWISAWMIHRNTYIDPKDPIAPIGTGPGNQTGTGGH